MYNKTIIEFGFSDMQNYQYLGNSYLPRLRLGDNSYRDINNSAYPKKFNISVFLYVTRFRTKTVGK